MILRVAIAFDDLRIRGISDHDAIARLRSDSTLDPFVISALASIQPGSVEREERHVSVSDLTTDMILQDEIRTNTGVLLAGKGQEVTYPMLVLLRNSHQRRAITGKFRVLAPAVAKAKAAGRT